MGKVLSKALKRICVLIQMVNIWVIAAPAETQVCQQIFSMEDVGGLLLHSRNPNLSSRYVAVRTANRAARLADIDANVLSPADVNLLWLKSLQRNYSRYAHNPTSLQRLHEAYHRQYVIPAERVPSSYYESLIYAARSKGYFGAGFNKKWREHVATLAIADQKYSLDPWIAFLVEAPTERYPAWVKYWIFQSVVKLGRYDPVSRTFQDRERWDIAPFAEFDDEALLQVVSELQSKFTGERMTETEFLKGIDLNFGNLYANAISAIKTKRDAPERSVYGVWVTYSKVSDVYDLVRSLQGMHTGWSTANLGSARSQLSFGAVYVYYTFDDEGQARRPRAIVRFNGEEIDEVLGTSEDFEIGQFHISNESFAQINDMFGDRLKTYFKHRRHLGFLNRIERKTQLNEELSDEELRFLYETNESIETTGSGRDPRIDRIRRQRNVRSDLARALHFEENEVALSMVELSRPGVKILYGNWVLNRNGKKHGQSVPDVVIGHIVAPHLESALGVQLPRVVTGNVDLSGLRSIEGLKLPQKVGGYLDLRFVETANGLQLSDEQQGDVYFTYLRSLEGVSAPKVFGGRARLRSIFRSELEKLGGQLFGNAIVWE